MLTNRSDRSLRPFLLLVAVLALAGCQAATEDPTPTEEPSIPVASVEPSATASAEPSATADTGGGEGKETSVFDLEVGDCFSADADQLDTVTVVDCEQSHEYEVFEVLDHEGGADAAYPGDQEILEYADEACQPSFEAFVGHDYQTSIWYITSLTPTTETWAGGDREIVCTLNQEDDDQEPISVTGTAEGSAE
ncbi:MAG: septum formation family protein [Candidatus Limnocylindria bacterium]